MTMELVLDACHYILYLALVLAFIRFVQGPSLLDRVLSIDAISVCVVGILIVLSVENESSFFIDLILVFSLINFIGTLTYVFYLWRRYEALEGRKEAFEKGEIAP